MRPTIPRRYFSVLTGVLWGTVYPGIVLALESFTALQFAFLRVTLATLTLGVVIVWWRSLRTLRIDRRALPLIGGLSLLGVGIFYLAQTFAVQFSTPINVAFIIASHPLLVAVVAPLALGEPIGRTDLVGLLLAMVGVYVIIGNGRIIPLFSTATFFGDTLALLGAITFALYLVCHRRWASRIDADQLTLTLFILGGAIPVLAAPVGVGGEFTVDLHPVAVGALVWVAVVATTGGYLALNIGLREETSVLTALRLLLIPFVSALVSAAVLGQPVTTIHVIGGTAIGIGILLPHLADASMGGNE